MATCDSAKRSEVAGVPLYSSSNRGTGPVVEGRYIIAMLLPCGPKVRCSDTPTRIAFYDTGGVRCLVWCSRFTRRFEAAEDLLPCSSRELLSSRSWWLLLRLGRRRRAKS